MTDEDDAQTASQMGYVRRSRGRGAGVKMIELST